MTLLVCVVLATPAQAGFWDTLGNIADTTLEMFDANDNSQAFAQTAQLTPVDVNTLYDAKQANPETPYQLTPDDKTLLANKRWRYFTAHETVFNSDVFVLEAGEKSKPTLLLIHGLGQNGLRDWLNVVPEFENRYHIVALDLPGFGLSPVVPGKYSPTNYALVAHQIALAFGLKNYTVIGHSMGGAVALRYASMFAPELQQLVLVDAAGILERTAFLKHAVEFPAKLYGLPDISVKWIAGVEQFGQSILETVTSWPDGLEYIRKFQYAWNKTLARNPNMNAATALIYEDFAVAAHETAVPTSIIWGENDGVTPMRTGIMLNSTLKQSSLHTVAGSGHTPMREKPVQFNKLLDAVLKSPPTKNNDTPMRASQSDKKLLIKEQTNRSYSGDYRDIEIVDSTAIKLSNVRAQRLSLTRSSVTLQNVQLASDTTAIIALEAAVEGTNVTIAAGNGILADNSRIDLANANIVADGEAVNIAEDSQIIFSASKIATPAYKGYAHGQYREENTTLKFAPEAK
ncbi:pimeloyl-ACP methyl ester carboxylesterase [Alteromonadaceae bacterium 2753L.S.0a.02]|nr:pimeloyl-ACP methyl ester carboxylesterase [Alteromonadaceae bacterium 2753L.S.0a.02]